MTFRNPIAALSGLLTYPQIFSEDFVSGQSGWIIRRDGTAEFNALGGSFQITASGIFFYIPSAGSGNLIASFTDTDGTDPYGNTYIGGFFLNQRRAHFTNNSDTIEINPTGASGPEIDWIPGGFNTMFSIIGDIASDLIRFVPSTLLPGHPSLTMQMEGAVSFGNNPVKLGTTDINSSWVSYTPFWTSSGTNPAIGNGTITGRTMRIGKTAFCNMRIEAGSTTTWGTGTYLFGFPFTAEGNALGTARFKGSTATWTGQVLLSDGNVQANLTFPSSATSTKAANMSATAPEAGDSASQITATLIYETV